MQKIFPNHKPDYFNTYQFLIKLLVLLIFALLCVSCNKKETQQILIVENKAVIAKDAVNINTAPVAELEKLPNIGAGLAKKIVEHREKYGNFRKPEYLILVQGISDKRFREMRNLIKTE